MLRALVCVGMVWLVSACGQSAGGAQDVVAADAPPEVVVRSYLEALNAHDLGVARRRLSPAYVEQVEEMADSPFDNWISVSNIEVSPAVDDTIHGGKHVAASFTLQQREEVSMENGSQSWGYQLSRDARTGRWLIVGEGVG